jgi:hypothetical protein
VLSSGQIGVHVTLYTARSELWFCSPSPQNIAYNEARVFGSIHTGRSGLCKELLPSIVKAGLVYSTDLMGWDLGSESWLGLWNEAGWILLHEDGVQLEL